LAIARALLKDAPILILDEATSALDNTSESAVKAAIDNLRHNRTTLVVAHRLSTVINADQIVVLEGGEVVQSGVHDELVRIPGAYQNLYHKAAKSIGQLSSDAVIDAP
jgi:subfamily B ATP-binding cassette protein MsbA